MSKIKQWGIDLQGGGCLALGKGPYLEGSLQMLNFFPIPGLSNSGALCFELTLVYLPLSRLLRIQGQK